MLPASAVEKALSVLYDLCLENDGVNVTSNRMKGGNTYRLGVWFLSDEMLKYSVTDQTNNHRRGWS